MVLFIGLLQFLLAGSKNVKVDLYLHGLEGLHGTVFVYVYDNAEDFPVHPDKAVARLRFNAAHVQPFKLELPPGDYAFAVYVDTNGNGRIDRNWLGIPSEPLALSGRPGFHFGPPHFDECKVHISGTRFRLDLRIRD